MSSCAKSRFELSQKRGERLGLKQNSESFKTQKVFGGVGADVCADGKAAS
jgi:hypothetical protein